MIDLSLPAFADIDLANLTTLSRDDMDRLPFGVVGMAATGIVEVYNATESRLAGLPADTVLGAHYFSTTAQCMNNFMVAQRFEDEPLLDATIDYVLTLRMRPTPVKLRLLKGAESARHYVLIQR
ncbi:hypothetical protein [Beijerinckia sp. L45]|uniref:hypothetical protein n=1 Tax=Beijerinckia sp. L45 TaxID=1641855 RepID=UPI001AEDC6BF|nr:hypothetical protein [Beijerinckia sp. L45]